MFDFSLGSNSLFILEFWNLAGYAQWCLVSVSISKSYYKLYVFHLVFQSDFSFILVSIYGILKECYEKVSVGLIYYSVRKSRTVVKFCNQSLWLIRLWLLCIFDA